MPGLPLVPDTINSSIDSLKEISSYFSVSIDDLLSGEQLIFIAEKENKFFIIGESDNTAEVDFLIQKDSHVIPVECKAGNHMKK